MQNPEYGSRSEDMLRLFRFYVKRREEELWAH